MTKIQGCTELLLFFSATAVGFNAHAQSPGVLHLSSHPSAGWELGWSNTGSGIAYVVQYQDSLQDGIWRIPASPLFSL